MEDLVAKVSATAEADVCVYGDDSAYAHVESHCIQAIYADVWAKVRTPATRLPCTQLRLCLPPEPLAPGIRWLGQGATEFRSRLHSTAL
jgi:hypothetical protein